MSRLARELSFKLALFSIAVSVLTGSCRAQTPDFYRAVNRVTWVVTNIDEVRPAWEAFGLTDIREFPNTPMTVTFRGKPSTVYVWQVTGHIGNLTVDMIQPAEGQLNAYTHFLAKHGDGIFSIVHEVPSEAALKAEIARMKAKGVDVLQEAKMPKQDATFTYFDTERDGKISLGLVYRPGGMKAVEAGAAARPALVQHFGFVVRDLPPVSAYWKGLGFEALKIDQVPARAGSTYQGAQLLLPHYEGSQKYNQYDYLWVAAPDVPANIYADYLNVPRHREGIQHIALSVADLPKEIARYGKLGYRVEQSGMWGQAGHPGSGAYAYMSTEKVGGLSVALFHPD